MLTMILAKLDEKEALMAMGRAIAVALALALTVGGTALSQTVGDPLAQAIGDPLPQTVGDPEKGERVFKKCKQCHTLERGQKKIGPSLAAIVGRRPGSIEGFKYSQDMADFGASGNLWNRVSLDAYLTKPRAMMKRTKMAFPGLKKKGDRADLIAYLAQF